jgi:hypothetical protein
MGHRFRGVRMPSISTCTNPSASAHRRIRERTDPLGDQVALTAVGRRLKDTSAQPRLRSGAVRQVLQEVELRHHARGRLATDGDDGGGADVEQGERVVERC